MSNVSFLDTIPALRTRLKKIAAPYSAAFILCDEHTQRHCLPLVSAALPQAHVISIKSGEEHKTLGTCTAIWSQLTEHHADRKALLVDLGGGVICDMGGFAASCYKRGIDFVQVPTTLLAMVDASVGGKTAIDFDGYKNQVGVFREPEAVLICADFLATLDPRQSRSGMAEVIKHYLIADAEAFHLLAKSPRLIRPDRQLIEKAVKIKSQFVDADPLEKNVRKALNFGHTIGHAVESYFLDSDTPMLHGEAVAIGMAVEAIISHQEHLLPADQMEEVLAVLWRYFDRRRLSRSDISHIVSLTAQDKKNSGDERRLVLLPAIGSYRIDVAVDTRVISKACIWYNNGK